MPNRHVHRRRRDMTNRIVPITESVNPESTNRWLPGGENDIMICLSYNIQLTLFQKLPNYYTMFLLNIYVRLNIHFWRQLVSVMLYPVALVDVVVLDKQQVFSKRKSSSPHLAINPIFDESIWKIKWAQRCFKNCVVSIVRAFICLKWILQWCIQWFDSFIVVMQRC